MADQGSRIPPNPFGFATFTKPYRHKQADDIHAPKGHRTAITSYHQGSGVLVDVFRGFGEHERSFRTYVPWEYVEIEPGPMGPSKEN